MTDEDEEAIPCLSQIIWLNRSIPEILLKLKSFFQKDWPFATKNRILTLIKHNKNDTKHTIKHKKIKDEGIFPYLWGIPFIVKASWAKLELFLNST